jgi:UDP-2-acetamido-2,6-beta-L-arabino-hexul-4-ose reductase
MNILVTGSKGFIGKNLLVSLKRNNDLDVFEYDFDSNPKELKRLLHNADVIFHLAGVNRPQHEDEFRKVNIDLSRQICDVLHTSNKKSLVIFSSSVQVTLDNPYGRSKKTAEDEFFQLNKDSGISVAVFRLPGVFGKWCRPNYNSVVATFCHNIARGLAITISDPDHIIELVYIDDVIEAFLHVMDGKIAPGIDGFYSVKKTYSITLGRLADTIRFFRESRKSLQLSDFNDSLIRSLYATYLSYLKESNFAYDLDIKTDNRGSLAEFLKSPSFGQIFVSRTRPGITRGNHYHDAKVEKFAVLEGDAIIRFRSILPEIGGQKSEVIEYPVSGREFKVVDIPPGYTHSIENVGSNDLIVLFWADEIFDSSSPDTFSMPVLQEK